MDCSEFVTPMSLKSTLQDVKETTLSAISGLLAKMAYLASLRGPNGRYQHWGVELMHGAESSERAWKTVHGEVLASVLRTPLATLEKDLQVSSAFNGVPAQEFVDDMREMGGELIPQGRENTPVSNHFNSVLLALSNLERNRARATRSTS